MAEEARVFFLRKRRERAEDTERREAARMFSLRRLERADNVERQELLTSLAHTRALIQQAYRGFNSAEDGDLIESYVFEINALQARYSYLLRRVKELDGEAQAQPG